MFPKTRFIFRGRKGKKGRDGEIIRTKSLREAIKRGY
jgi:hypothetical protein